MNVRNDHDVRVNLQNLHITFICYVKVIGSWSQEQRSVKCHPAIPWDRHGIVSQCLQVHFSHSGYNATCLHSAAALGVAGKSVQTSNF